MDNKNTLYVQPGDIVLLVGKDRKESITFVEPGKEFQTHHGVLRHDTIIGRQWGESVTTHLGYAYQILPPSLEQLVRSIRRATQIVYPKEIGYLLMKMNIGPGTHIIEAGTGSGGLTLALARMVMPHGHVYPYEARPETQGIAGFEFDLLPRGNRHGYAGPAPNDFYAGNIHDASSRNYTFS